jgi:hypothetical protein
MELMTSTQSRSACLALALALVLVLVLCACTARESAADRPSTSPAESRTDADARSLASVLGAHQVYVMAGDDPLRAGLGILDEGSNTLEPHVLDPEPALISNLSGNGRRVILGAAGVGQTGSDQVMSDGVYAIDGDRLTTLAEAGAGLFGPVESAEGVVAVIDSRGGVSTRGPDDRSWRRDGRLPKARLTTLAWAARGDLLTVVDPQNSSARLVRLRASGGVDTVGSAHCASVILASPDGWLVATVPQLDAHAPARCRRGVVVDIRSGQETAVPRGWRPLAWTPASDALLVSRDQEIGVWNLATGFEARVDVGVRTWMAAIVYAEKQ